MAPIQSIYPPLPKLPPVLNAHDFLVNHLHAPAGGLPDFPYLEDADTGKKLSSHGLRERARDGATALQTVLGLSARKGDKVGILSDNCVDYIALIHACLYSTIPFVPISAYSTAFELEYLFRQSQISHLFVHPRLLPAALAAAKKVGLKPEHVHILEHHAKYANQTAGRLSFDDLVQDVVKRDVPRVKVSPAPKDTLAYLLFSSGTSGKPKGVMVSHNNLCGQIFQWAVVGGVIAQTHPPPPPPEGKSYHVELVFLPFHHTFGMNTVATRALMTPQTILIMPTWNMRHALDLIVRHRVSRFPLVPSIAHQLVQTLVSESQKPGFNRHMLKTLQTIGSGGAYLPPQLGQQLKTFAPNVQRVTQGFGMSECTISATIQVPDGSIGGKAKYVPGSVGLLLPGNEARLVKADGTDASVGEPGELYLRGPTVAMGYWGPDFVEATRETFLPDGWLRTGDIFKIDDHGNLFFEDRVKDTLKISGMQVAPTEIEDMLCAHPDKLVTDASVAGVRGGRTSDEKVPRAWVVLSQAGRARGERSTLDALHKWVQENLSKYKWLRGGIAVVDEIPKSPTGKVLRRLLQDEYEKQSADSVPKAKL